jgi:hypothetical protein
MLTNSVYYDRVNEMWCYFEMDPTGALVGDIGRGTCPEEAIENFEARLEEGPARHRKMFLDFYGLRH